jgi:LacI family transcriptional regulator
LINPQTKNKVLDMAKKMNYTPNLNAKSLAKHSSNTIGIIIPSIVSSSFYPEILQGIQEILTEQKYNSIINQKFKVNR